jgi:uncharacterized phiE125 gp8 family phage protein
VAITESHTLITAPSESVLSLEEAKAQIKYEDPDGVDDDLIQSLAFAADRMAENKTNRAFMQATYEYVADQWPSWGIIKLWPGNLVSVTSVKYYNSENVLTTMSADDYEVNTRSKPGRIIISELPSLYDRFDAIVITYVVGYGAAGAEADVQRAAVPEDVKAWMKLNFATLYEHRQLFTDGQVQMGSIHTYADSLIYPYIL